MHCVLMTELWILGCSSLQTQPSPYSKQNLLIRGYVFVTQQQRVTRDQHLQSRLFFAAYVSSTILDDSISMIREAWPACCALFPSTLCNEPGIEALPQVNNIEICKSFKLFIKGVQQNFCPHSKSGS